jgi:hypothetical protein
MGIVAVASLAERKSSTPVNDNVYFETHQLSRERGKAIDFSLMTSPFNDNVFPSTYPSSRRPWRNACVRADTEVEPRYPIRRIFVGCCAQTGRQKAMRRGLQHVGT